MGIDYSTPPKFIDYGIPSVGGSLQSTADKPIDINELKQEAKDINVEQPKPNMDSFLQVDSKDNAPKEQENSNFKFFSPFEDTHEEKKEETDSKSLETAFDNLSPFSLGGETKPLEDTTSTSMDSLLAGVENKQEHPSPNPPSFDAFNNPFAKNPIFQDNVQSLTQEQVSKPKYTLNESINIVRDSVKKIEESGFKVDVEEMDFASNYQIVIKISKENNPN